MIERSKVSFCANPFVKWAGGKGQLITQYHRFFPDGYNNYIEPFVGGGAVFFYLHNQRKIYNKAILNDTNKELVNCYEIIKENVEALIKELKVHELRKKDRNTIMQFEHGIESLILAKGMRLNSPLGPSFLIEHATMAYTVLIVKDSLMSPLVGTKIL